MTISEKRKKLIEIMVRNNINIKGYQRKSKSGHVTTIKPHQRKGEMKKKGANIRSDVKPTAKHDLFGLKAISSGKQTTLTGTGKIVLPETAKLLRKMNKGEEVTDTAKSKALMKEYNRIMELQQKLVVSLGGIEKARENPLYQRIIKEQADRLKQYFRLTKEKEKKNDAQKTQDNQ